MAETRTRAEAPSGLRAPYRIAAHRHRLRESRAPLRQGSYRALAATFNHFTRSRAR